MKKMSEISVIIPVYNVEKYLDRCITSILKQDFKDYEIVLIDDGSTDNSGRICDKYSKKYDFIKSIHKENGGLSDARNVGIEKSTGKYLTFIDSDDFIASNFLSVLYNLIISNDADVVISGLKDVYEDNLQDIILEQNIISYVINREEAYRKMLIQEDIDVSATAKLYSRKIFDTVRYPVGSLYEDIQVIDLIIEKSAKIVYTNYKGYYYFQRTGSIMYGKMSNKRMILIDTMEKLLQKITLEYPNIKDAAIKRYVYCNYHILGRAILDKKFKLECKNIRNNILHYKKEIFNLKYFTKKEKVATVFLIIGLEPYKLLWKIYCRISNKNI